MQANLLKQHALLTFVFTWIFQNVLIRGCAPFETLIRNIVLLSKLGKIPTNTNVYALKHSWVWRANISSNRHFRAYLRAALFTELREHAFRYMFLKLKSDLDDLCHHHLCSIFSKRTTKNEKKISLLYLCSVWSEPPLFDSLFIVYGLVHGILALIAPASSDGLDEPLHNYAQSRQSLRCPRKQSYVGSVQIHASSPNRYICLNMHF